MKGKTGQYYRDLEKTRTVKKRGKQGADDGFGRSADVTSFSYL